MTAGKDRQFLNFKLKKMYRQQQPQSSEMTRIICKEGETIENRLKRIMKNNEPISDSAPINYTERKDGVKPEYNPRTDLWEIAAEGMQKVAQIKLSEREARQAAKNAAIEGEGKKDNGETPVNTSDTPK